MQRAIEGFSKALQPKPSPVPLRGRHVGAAVQRVRGGSAHRRQ